MAIIEQVDLRKKHNTEQMICSGALRILAHLGMVDKIILTQESDRKDLSAMVGPVSGFEDIQYIVKPGFGGLAYISFTKGEFKPLENNHIMGLTGNYNLLYELE